MDRRGHAMQGMDRVYMRVTARMRQRLVDGLEDLWRNAIAQRCELAETSNVPLLNNTLTDRREGLRS